MHDLKLAKGNVNFLLLNINSKLLATYSDANIIYIWSVETGKLVNTIHPKGGIVQSLLFNDYDHAIVAQYTSGTFKTFNIDKVKKHEYALVNSQGIEEEKTNSVSVMEVNEFITIDVMYGTNRKKTGAKTPNEFFGKKFGKLSYGLCQVSIPIIHKAGEIERPDWFKFEYEEDPRKHVMIQNLNIMNKASFREYMKKSFSSMGKKDILIFIHGFSNKFDESVRRAGQIAYDLDFPGLAMTYSWPSQGSFSSSNYEQDEVFSKKSIPYLKKFLLDVVKNAPNQKINIIAHSMGNRVLVNAIADIQKKSKGTLFNQVILAAPDVNAKIFKEEILPKMQGKANNITLYASSEDKALMASRILHNQSRLGESGEFLTVAPGLVTIDSTGVDPSTMGHSYFSSTKTLLVDIKHLMLKDEDPKNRNLKEVRSQGQNHWKILLNNRN